MTCQACCGSGEELCSDEATTMIVVNGPAPYREYHYFKIHVCQRHEKEWTNPEDC